MLLDFFSFEMEVETPKPLHPKDAHNLFIRLFAKALQG
jgi:hypothetical protein